MIFKIQKELTGGKKYLLYNKDRTIITDNLKVGDIPDLDKAFEHTNKIYSRGYVNRKHQIILSRIVEEQDW